MITSARLLNAAELTKVVTLAVEKLLHYRLSFESNDVGATKRFTDLTDQWDKLLAALNLHITVNGNLAKP